MKPTAKTVSARPTENDEVGLYVVITNGIYFGHWCVVKNRFCKFVARADERDGRPY